MAGIDGLTVGGTVTVVPPTLPKGAIGWRLYQETPLVEVVRNWIDLILACGSRRDLVLMIDGLYEAQVSGKPPLFDATTRNTAIRIIALSESVGVAQTALLTACTNTIRDIARGEGYETP